MRLDILLAVVLCLEKQKVAGQHEVRMVLNAQDTSQSSIWDYNGEGPELVSSLAVDGNYDQGNGGGGNGRTCMHTLGGVGNWWQVNLVGAHHLNRVRIFNRMDCCSERLSPFRIEAQLAKNGPLQQCYRSNGSTAGVGVIDVSCPSREVVAVRIVSEADTYLHLCEVEIYENKFEPGRRESIYRLLIKAPVTSQSSIWDYNGEGPELVSSLAFDGNYDQGNGSGGNGRTCMHTLGGEGNWWQVDLGSNYYVAQVRVYNRMDCCSERLGRFRIEVQIGKDGPFKQCYRNDASTENVAVIEAPCVEHAVAVRIVSEEDTFLHLCEVEIYVIPPRPPGFPPGRG